MRWPKVSIIILNWNGWEDTIECLESLYQITYPNYDVILVDNGSEDYSVVKIKEWAEGNLNVESKFFKYDFHNKPIEILEYERTKAEEGGNFQKEERLSRFPSNKKLRTIKNEKNYGFAEGNNIGVRYTLKALNPNYILLLNNDTVVEADFLTELVKVAESDTGIGIVGPKIYYYDKLNKIWFAGGKLWLKLGQPHHIGLGRIDKREFSIMKETDFITGCALLIKTDLINCIGLFAEEYFAYFEDLEWNTKAKEIGYKVIFAPAAKLWHKTSTTLERFSPTYTYLHARNRIIFVRKNTKKFEWLFFFLPYFLGIRTPRTLVPLILKWKWKTICAFIRGARDGFDRKL